MADDSGRCTPEGGRSERPATDGVRTDGGASASLPTLPPPGETPGRVLAVSGRAINGYHPATVTEMVRTVDPDVVVATAPDAGVVRPALARRVDPPVVEADAGMRPTATALADGAVALVATPGGDDAFSAEAVERGLAGDDSETDARPSTADHVCLVTADVSLSVDPYERSAALTGVERYRTRVPDPWWGSGTTHLSTRLRAGYTATRAAEDSTAEARFVGIGSTEADLGVGAAGEGATATLVEAYTNGAVDTAALGPDEFGLRSVDGVGERRSETLRSAGVADVADLAATPPGRLADLDGIGRTVAERIRTAAEARATGTVLPTGDDRLPAQEPVFVDVETDGLNPSTAWLVGALDGRNGNYMSFRERGVGDGAHLEAFVTWLTGAAAGRPVVAWNGYDFDFPVIRDQLRQHHPDLVSAWDDCYQFDALWWATRKNGGNAALPGRTNELERVATALGWAPTTDGVDGGTVAELYAAYRERVVTATDPTSVPTPDWERLERYCEDDVRALATVYDRLREAARRDPVTDPPTGSDTSQGSLADFS